MLIVSNSYKVLEIKETSFEKVPRAVMRSESSSVAVDYHADLCPLKENDTVKIEVHIGELPIHLKNTYLTYGKVYKIDEKGFEISCGGLLFFYQGQISEDIQLEAEAYISMVRI